MIDSKIYFKNILVYDNNKRFHGRKWWWYCEFSNNVSINSNLVHIVNFVTDLFFIFWYKRILGSGLVHHIITTSLHARIVLSVNLNFLLDINWKGNLYQNLFSENFCVAFLFKIRMGVKFLWLVLLVSWSYKMQ